MRVTRDFRPGRPEIDEDERDFVGWAWNNWVAANTASGKEAALEMPTDTWPALLQAAWAASSSKDTYLRALFYRVKARIGVESGALAQKFSRH
jgi:hypothetical protein